MASQAMTNTGAGGGLMPALSAGLKPMLLLVGLAAAVAAGVGVTLWTKGPTYSVLYATLPDAEAAAVTKALSAAGIEYRVDPGSGSLSIPAERIHEARMLLAEQGTLSTGGFANLAQENGFGMSQFMEGARYQHALEQELARTISSMQQVASARVHIASARNSTFIRDRTPGRASVFLQLRSGRRLSSEQVDSIVNLVGSAVPDIDTSQITVVDQGGRLLSSPRGRDEFAAREQLMDFARQLEEMYAQRVEALISPLVGPGRVRAEVSAQVDMSASEEAREQFSPQSAVVRSEQISEDRSGQSTVAIGVPGSASNQAAPAPAQAPPGAPAQAAATTPGAAATSATPTSTQATRNYEIDRTVAYTRQPAGRLRRVSVAVLVDNIQVQGRDGRFTEAPLTREQIDRITTLVKDAVGFDAARGDSVSVVNSPWRGEPRVPEGEMESLPIWEQAWFLDVLKLAAGLLALVMLVLFVVRPLLQRLTDILAPPRSESELDDDYLPAIFEAAGAGGLAKAGGEGGDGVGGEPGAKPAGVTKYEQNVQAARALVQGDSARVAQVVRKWAMNNA
jgi:flagellar M-ring protein FliF